MVDNFRIFESWFDKLKSDQDFYYIQVIQRKKDGVELPSCTSGARIIRSFYINSKERYLQNESYIKDLCKNNNARAYFWPNPRNSYDVTCNTITKFVELLKSGNTNHALSIFNKAAGNSRSVKYDKLWIVDVDFKDIETVFKVIKIIDNCRQSDKRFREIVFTVNGYHIITNGFDRNQFSKIYPNIDIHTDNPTLLYYE